MESHLIWLQTVGAILLVLEIQTSFVAAMEL